MSSLVSAETCGQKLSSGGDEAAVSHQASQPEHRHLRGAGQGSHFHGDGTHQRAEGGQFGAAADVTHEPADRQQSAGRRSRPVQQQERRRAASLSGNAVTSRVERHVWAQDPDPPQSRSEAGTWR